MNSAEPSSGDTASLQPFPRTFHFANAVELCERMAHYGFYIGLAIYLRKFVGMSDIEVGFTLGNVRFVGSLAPIPCGAIADRITFKRSLVVAFRGYANAPWLEHGDGASRYSPEMFNNPSLLAPKAALASAPISPSAPASPAVRALLLRAVAPESSVGVAFACRSRRVQPGFQPKSR